jgi:hypothetical protein
LNAGNAHDTSMGAGSGLPVVANPHLLQVYSVIDPNWGIAFHRIDRAFRRFSPRWVKWVDRLEDADVHIMHFLGASPAHSTRCAHRAKSYMEQHGDEPASQSLLLSQCPLHSCRCSYNLAGGTAVFDLVSEVASLEQHACHLC